MKKNQAYLEDKIESTPPHFLEIEGGDMPSVSIFLLGLNVPLFFWCTSLVVNCVSATFAPHSSVSDMVNGVNSENLRY